MNAFQRPVKFASRQNSEPIPTKYALDRWTSCDPPGRTLTQQEQDEEDDEKRREALRNLVESWMDRLQLISVISTFFASAEASMLSTTAPDSSGLPMSLTAQLANIGMLGGLIVHSNAAIISFLAAFFLVRYKLKIAKEEEEEVEEHLPPGKRCPPMVQSPSSVHSNNDMEKGDPSPAPRRLKIRTGPNWDHDTDPIPGAVKIVSPAPGSQTVWSKNPHLVQVGPFNAPQPPTHLLGRCHALCVFLTVVGFVLALMGILCFAWDRLPRSVSVPSSAIMAMCVLSGVFIVYKPIPPEQHMSGRIYVR